MADLPYLPLWVQKFEGRTTHLTLEEDGAYNRLLRLSWVTPNCQVPADDAWIARRMRVDQATYDRVVRPVLDEFFYKEDGYWRNEKLRDVWRTSGRLHRQRQAAGSRGGKTKARKQQEKESELAAGLLGPPLEANGKQNDVSYTSKAAAKAAAAAGLPAIIRKSLGPGFAHRGRLLTDQAIEEAAADWLALGATPDEIVEVVRRQTELERPKPLRSLKVIEPDIEAEIEARNRPQHVDPKPEPLERPPGNAGKALAAIIASVGEVKAAVWLHSAVWTENEVALPTEMARDKVAVLFGGILRAHGITPVLCDHAARQSA